MIQPFVTHLQRSHSVLEAEVTGKDRPFTPIHVAPSAQCLSPIGQHKCSITLPHWSDETFCNWFLQLLLPQSSTDQGYNEILVTSGTCQYQAALYRTATYMYTVHMTQTMAAYPWNIIRGRSRNFKRGRGGGGGCEGATCTSQREKSGGQEAF